MFVTSFSRCIIPFPYESTRFSSPGRYYSFHVRFYRYSLVTKLYYPHIDESLRCGRRKTQHRAYRIWEILFFNQIIMSIPINYTDEVLDVPVIYDDYGPIHYSRDCIDLAAIVGYRPYVDYESHGSYILEYVRV